MRLNSYVSTTEIVAKALRGNRSYWTSDYMHGIAYFILANSYHVSKTYSHIPKGKTRVKFIAIR